MPQRMNRRTLLGTGLTLAGSAAIPAAGAEPAAGTKPHRAAPLAQDFTIVYHNTDHRLYVEGCGLIKLGDGVLLAVVPIVPRAELSQELRVEHSHTHLVQSTDQGRTWQEISKLPYYSAAPWLHQGKLYLFAFEPGAKKRNDNALLLRSDDGGWTWSKPTTLFTGHFWNTQTSLVVRNDTLYWCFDDISRGTIHQRTLRVIAGDLKGDVMDAKSWRIAEPVAFPGVPSLLSSAQFVDRDDRFLEPNLIEVRGRLRVVASVKADAQTTANLGAVFDVDDTAGKLTAKFTQFYPVPGGQSHLSIVRDEPSKLFWLATNFAVDSQEAMPWWDEAREHGSYRKTSNGGDDRRFLMLLYGVDGLNWFPAGCVAQAPKLSQSFMYATPIVDGDDLAIISRTSINAPHQHDADHATFHRVRDFRELALDLFPGG